MEEMHTSVPEISADSNLELVDNTTEDATPVNFDMVMGVWLPGIISMLGILGNSVSLVVLSSDRSNSTSFLTLKALAFSDIALLFLALWQQVIPVYTFLVGCQNSFCLNFGYIRLYTWPVICIAQMNSIWLTVLISAERYTAICTPLHSKSIRSIPRVRLAIVLVLVASILFNIPKFFEFQTVKEFAPQHNVTFIVIGDTELRRHLAYRYVYNTALYCLIIFAMPLTILSLLNISIVKHMREAHRRWENLNRLQQRELKATTIPLCIVFVFLVCGTLSFTAFVLDAVFVDLYFLWLQIFTAVVNLFVILNSAINFVIFYLFGSKFRVLCKRVLLCPIAGLNIGNQSQARPILVRQFRRPTSDDRSGRLESIVDLPSEPKLIENSYIAEPASFNGGPSPTTLILKECNRKRETFSV